MTDKEMKKIRDRIVDAEKVFLSRGSVFLYGLIGKLDAPKLLDEIDRLKNKIELHESS